MANQPVGAEATPTPNINQQKALKELDKLTPKELEVIRKYYIYQMKEEKESKDMQEILEGLERLLEQKIHKHKMKKYMKKKDWENTLNEATKEKK